MSPWEIQQLFSTAYVVAYLLLLKASYLHSPITASGGTLQDEHMYRVVCDADKLQQHLVAT